MTESNYLPEHGSANEVEPQPCSDPEQGWGSGLVSLAGKILSNTPHTVRTVGALLLLLTVTIAGAGVLRLDIEIGPIRISHPASADGHVVGPSATWPTVADDSVVRILSQVRVTTFLATR